MSGLAEFVLARISEDEADLEDPRGWDPLNHWWLPRWVTRDRLLAECEAKRRIVEDEHFDGRSGDYIEPWCVTCSEDEELIYLPCPTLCLLALPYADHPDYRPEWKP